LDAQYRFPVGSALDAYVGSTVTANSSTFGILPSGHPSTDALVNLPHYTLLDVRAGLQAESGKWRIEAWGRNVTDRYYLTGTIRAADYYSRFAGIPATYGASVFWRY
jgi:outer membrane receptor protein involved in Fe transport